MFKHSGVLLILLSLITALCQAQTGELNAIDEENLLIELTETERVFIDLGTPTNNRNQTVLEQSGNKNEARINQVNPQAGPVNRSAILQRGNKNQSDLQQTGEGLDFSLVQRGNSNSFSGTQTGSDIKSNVQQLGNNNNVEQDLSGSTLDYLIIQNGNNNSVIQRENSDVTNAPSYEIRQTGSGMNIQIENSTLLK